MIFAESPDYQDMLNGMLIFKSLYSEAEVVLYSEISLLKPTSMMGALGRLAATYVARHENYFEDLSQIVDEQASRISLLVAALSRVTISYEPPQPHASIRKTSDHRPAPPLLPCPSVSIASPLALLE